MVNGVPMPTQNHRISVSLPEGHYAALQRLAEEKRVSIAWVIREAVRQYVDMESPLWNEIRSAEDGDNVRA